MRRALFRGPAAAVRVVAMNPLDENNQALLIRAYRTAGDDGAAALQLAACTELFARELGVVPGPAVQAAVHSPVDSRDELDDVVSVEAIVEATRLDKTKIIS